MGPEQSLVDVLLSPPVVVTFFFCVLAAGVVIWLVSAVQRRGRERALRQQRESQESTIERVLDSVAKDKDEIIADYEGQLKELQARISSLEKEAARLRDRLSSSGLLSLFGGKQRDAVGALLLENEQLHELLAQKQEQLRDMMADMSQKLVERLDEQAQQSARGVRYKQALLSAFLQHDEARKLLDRMLADGRVSSQAETPQLEEE